MAALLIDTLSFASQLRTTGFTSQQADGLARALYDSVLDKIATKHDADGLKKNLECLRQDVEVLKQDIGIVKKDVEVMKQDIDIVKKGVADIKQSIAALYGHLTAKMSETKTEIIQWFVGCMFVMGGLNVGLLKLML